MSSFGSAKALGLFINDVLSRGRVRGLPQKGNLVNKPPIIKKTTRSLQLIQWQWVKNRRF